MDNKKIKIAIIVAVVVIVIISIAIVLLGSNKNKTPNQSEVITPTKVSARKEVKEDNIQTVVGKILSIDANVENIEVGLNDGRKLNLYMQSGEFSVIKQGKKKDGTFVNETIGLLDVPKNQDVEIQYNAKNDELIMIVVNKF
ncbi:MAG: hypothetical protein US30_C0004G0051 [Candidatus Moranbacteria bacterium GW2011_GWF2_36_839]|nr:MAG: hypothetical protein US27_C0002G0054 [Candidatus Moranbacteria bacterium GW2011_GWF1_36_78]KKQ17307.1 MAG: hypothetical protein US30_C0004G0051 [Candidatus Moranbacteria bacterium GW2011_GWF2_36_839]HAT73848.1 hypothetical protein [Candidatus Moranbacteria bacterium]HBY11009.1 hypothetical protein [Candidatus Moranbacteria bacterium]